MKKKEKIRLALDVLEKEMAVLSSQEILRILGGEGEDPLGQGYCVFNQMEMISRRFGGSTEAGTWLKNYNNQHGTEGFEFDSSGNVVSVLSGGDTAVNDFMNKYFEKSEPITNQQSEWWATMNDSSKMLIGSIQQPDGSYHAIEMKKGTIAGCITWVDSTTGTEHVNTDDLTKFKLVMAVSGLKETTGTTGWDSGSIDHVNPPSTGGSSSGSTGG